MAMTTFDERRAILTAEYQRLEDYLHTLTPEAWEHPSTCDQWTVADVMAHLTVGSRNHATWMTEALAQRVPSERLPRRSHQRIDAAAFAHTVIGWRHEVGTNLLSAFVSARMAIEDAVAQVTPDDWVTLRYR